jgi:hypothetical protein
MPISHKQFHLQLQWLARQSRATHKGAMGSTMTHDDTVDTHNVSCS